MSDELLDIARKMLGLLELLAEDKIAERDAMQRLELRRIAGKGQLQQKAIILMDGTRAQKDIITESAISKGNLSTLVSKLSDAGLLAGEKNPPQLTISIPRNFFD